MAGGIRQLPGPDTAGFLTPLLRNLVQEIGLLWLQLKRITFFGASSGNSFSVNSSMMLKKIVQHRVYAMDQFPNT
jgi:hypothetical protein